MNFPLIDKMDIYRIRMILMKPPSSMLRGNAPFNYMNQSAWKPIELEHAD